MGIQAINKKVIVRNKFDILQEITDKYTPNDEYENFINVYKEVIANQNEEPNVISWEWLEVRKKQGYQKKRASFLKYSQWQRWPCRLGLLQYIDCLSEKGYAPPPTKCHGYDIKQSDGETRNAGV